MTNHQDNENTLKWRLTIYGTISDRFEDFSNVSSDNHLQQTLTSDCARYHSLVELQVRDKTKNCCNIHATHTESGSQGLEVHTSPIKSVNPVVVRLRPFHCE